MAVLNGLTFERLKIGEIVEDIDTLIERVNSLLSNEKTKFLSKKALNKMLENLTELKSEFNLLISLSKEPNLADLINIIRKHNLSFPTKGLTFQDDERLSDQYKQILVRTAGISEATWREKQHSHYTTLLDFFEK